jgi:flavin reductase (DIM6/NTAB) family NADH-FMN oxidoreductase RutF
MFYKADEPHGLPYNPFKAIVAPRPIGWISTLDGEGVPNLAPYSFFNGVCDTPPILMFSSGGMKDSAANVEATGEFTFNYVSRSMKDEMNISSAPHPAGVNEFDKAGLEMAPGETVACPRVAGAAAALECKLLEIVNPTILDGSKAPYFLILGQVTGVHIDDSMITAEGRFDTMKADPILRSGYHDYVCLDELFELVRPDTA